MITHALLDLGDIDGVIPGLDVEDDVGLGDRTGLLRLLGGVLSQTLGGLLGLPRTIIIEILVKKEMQTFSCSLTTSKAQNTKKTTTFSSSSESDPKRSMSSSSSAAAAAEVVAPAHSARS